MKVLFLTRYGRLGASSRLRTYQFLPFLEQYGIASTVQVLFSDALLAAKYATGHYGVVGSVAAYGARVAQLLLRDRYDLVWIEKEALPWLPTWLERALLRGMPYVLDFDDAVFHNYDLHRSALVRRTLGQRLDRLMAHAALVTCGNDYLAQRAQRAGAARVEIVPTVIDLEHYQLFAHTGAAPLVPRIVWIGSPSTAKYLRALAAPLAALAERHTFQLRVIGANVVIPGVDVECLAWTEATEVAAIAACEVGIMPLDDSPWERGKCGYKLIQYMACGLPVVASPVGVNRDIVSTGVNGYLAGSEAEWVDALAGLLDDVQLRQQMGRAGRKIVEQKYSVQVTAPRLARLYRKARKEILCAD